jgi:transcriptional regulator with XRE-family HTH domain
MTTATTATRRPVGEQLRQWRERRRLSQLELSIQANVSTRHLSFVETGRAKPTSEMILRLTEHLDVPLRERNSLLLAGGFAPAYPSNDLQGPELAAILAAVRQVLSGHEPYPALVVDRGWTLIEANTAVERLTAGADPALLEPPVNVLRLALHPDGMAPRIANLPEWRGHLLGRLHREATVTGDATLLDLYEELHAYPGGESNPAPGTAAVAVPLRYRLDGQELSFISTTAVFGTPLDVTVSELAIEAFYPADASTAAALRV